MFSELALTRPEDMAGQFSNRVILAFAEATRDQIREWCRENVASQYQFDIIEFYSVDDHKNMRLITFAKKEDAMAFKLTFV